MSTSKKFPLIIALLLIISILPVLGLPGIFSSSEARETHVAAIIKSSNEWILPDRNGFVPSKPLLHHWLTVATAYVTGAVDEFSSRFPSAVLGICVIIFTFCFSRKILKVAIKNEEQAFKLASLTSLILITSYGFFSMMFLSMVDMTFSAFVVFALFTAWSPIFDKVLSNTSEVRIDSATWCKFFLCCGLATLAKGPLGLVLPGIMLGTLLLSFVGFKQTVKILFRPNWGWLIFIVLALPWYYLAQHRSQSAFVERQIFFENVKRFFGGENINSEPFWFYIPSFLLKCAPWSGLFVILTSWYFYLRPKASEQKRIAVALLSALAAAFVFFSVSSGKRHSYLLPLLPICTFTGVWIYAQWSSLVIPKLQKKVDELFIKIFNILICIIIVLSGAIAITLAVNPTALMHKPEFSVARTWILSNSLRLSLAPILSLFVLAFVLLGSGLKKYLNLSKIFLITSFLCSILIASMGIKGSYRDYSAMAGEILALAQNRQIVAVRDRFDELLDPIFYYVNAPLKVVPPLQVEQYCSQDVMLISRRGDLPIFSKNVQVLEEKVLLEKVGKPKTLQERAISIFSCKATV